VNNRYLGYCDANPTTLMPLSPQDSAPLCVEMMGGPNKIMIKSKAAL
jgi:alkyl sulfatase BDS1-like metallo-beta-lactamase superfamily hydrolase